MRKQSHRDRKKHVDHVAAPTSSLSDPRKHLQNEHVAEDGVGAFSHIEDRSPEIQRRIFQAIIDNAHTQLVYLDPHFNFVVVNAAYAKTCNRTPDELVGKNHFALYPHEENQEIFMHVRDTGQAVSFHDKPFVFSDQPERGITYWDWTLTPVKDESGNVEGLVFSLVDTTERKRAEEALRESEQQLHFALRSSGAGTWNWDLKDQRLEWSRELYTLFGLDPDGTLATLDAWNEALHPDDRDVANHRISQAIENRTVLDSEYRVIHPGGKVLWIKALGNTEYDPSGNPLRMAGICIDITEHKEMEEELRESEQRFSNAFAYAAIGMALISPEGHWLKVNNAICDIVGYPEKELLTKTFQDITHPDDLEVDLTYVRRMLAGEIPTYQMEKRYYHKLGHIVWVLLSVSLVWDNQGRPLYFISQIQDITVRKLAEEGLLRTAERDRHIADVLQQTLVPSGAPMQPPGFEIAAKYQPALREAEVCGDFYDVFDIDGDGKIGIAIGDMVGKGLHAAAHVAAVRHTIRSYAFLGARPADVVTRVNEAIFKAIENENDMLTAFFAILDTHTGELTYTNAGHEPPLLMHMDGQTEFMTEGGPMFSGMIKHVYSEGVLSLQADDVLVLVTDGITESRKVGQSEQFEMEGVIRSLAKNMCASAEEIATRLLEDAKLFGEGSFRDDVALVVIKKLNVA